MLFAEAFSQTLTAGLEVNRALTVAAGAVRSRRFRSALREMASNYRAGDTLADSLSRTGVVVSGELLAALAIGEERGGLADQLAAFAGRCNPHPRARLAAAVGRPPATTRFATALAQLLKDHRLTVGLIEDAAQLAAGQSSAFTAVVRRVTEAMRAGSTFAEALGQEPGTFDPLFCNLVGAPEGRDHLRAVLARLGEGSVV